MSEQETFNKTGVNDSTDVAQIIEEKPVDSSEKISNDLKLPVSTEVESKNANSFQSTVKTDSDDKNIDTRADESSLTEHKNLGNVGVSEQNSGTIITANITVQPKKKISFQVTSIESTEGRSRGDSNGYDDIDELNETEDVEEEEIYNESGVAHVLGNGNGTSRFKVVKIPRYDSKPYTRGRWRCWDFVKYPPPSAEHLLPDLPGCNSDVSNEKGDADPVIRSTLTFSSNTGALSLSSNQNIDFPATEGNSQANLSSETNCDDKSHIITVLDAVENSFVSKADNGPDELLNSISAVENAGASISEAAVANTDEGLSRLDSEDDRVAEKILKAMSQVVQIKTDLLQGVNEDVKKLKSTIQQLTSENQKLKSTIQQLTSENQRLKEENESLRQQLQNPSS